MAKANTKHFDRMIETAARKLQGVRDRELWALTAGEQARVAGHIGAAVVKATRKRSFGASERGVERIWENAAARYQAEITAAEKAKVAAISEAARAKAAKKSSGWW
jgi:hypothetical protein